MAKKTVTTRKGLGNTKIHLDENGRLIGTSRKGLFGEEIYLDENGRYAGSKRTGILGEEYLFDENEHLAGTVRDGVLGTKVITDSNGKYAGSSYRGMGEKKITILEDDGEDGDAEEPAEMQQSGGVGKAGPVLAAVVIVIVACVYVLIGR